MKTTFGRGWDCAKLVAAIEPRKVLRLIMVCFSGTRDGGDRLALVLAELAPVEAGQLQQRRGDVALVDGRGIRDLSSGWNATPGGRDPDVLGSFDLRSVTG